MSLRTSSYATWKAAFESLVGIEQGGLQTDEALAVQRFFNKAIRRAWESNYWLDVCYIEERTPDENYLIDWAQDGLTEIGEVFAVYRTSPYASALPGRVGYTLTRDGIQLVGATTTDAVWVHYRARCPVYPDPNVSTILTDEAGNALTDDAGNPLMDTDGDTFPYIFFEYCLHAAFADWLRSDGQNDKAAQADAQAQELLDYEHDKLERQQAFSPSPVISTHLTSRA